ncbi:MAG: riboflavin synthase, partial [Flavobacteriales bacterium]|nr:riboflavin synthase [Flavobacteriales bacterium]
MFTGIIESISTVVSLKNEGNNLNISCKSEITNELKIDQSLSHNGACLTVVKIEDDMYTVTAIKETLEKSNLGGLKIGDKVNLERSMKLGDRLDGHIVQGHVDQKAKCINIVEENGSWMFTFEYKP